MEPSLERYIEKPTRCRELLRRVYHEATLAGLPLELVLALTHVESA